MLFILLFATGRAHAQVTIQELRLGGLTSLANANVIRTSPDGSAVFYETSEDSPEGSFTKIFRWTSAGVQQIGEDLPPNFWLDVDYVNTNGTMAAGEVSWSDWASGEGGSFAWRWTLAGGLVTNIGDLSDFPNYTYRSLEGTSSDGSVLVGSAGDGWWDGHSRAFRWKNNVTTDLGVLPGDTESDVYGGIVSPDGSVVVGLSWNFNTPSEKHICRWSISSANVVTRIKIDLAGGSDSYIDYINTNGTVLTGGVWGGSSVVWRWTLDGGLVTNIGVLPNFPAGVLRTNEGTSSDGSVVVGSSSTSGGYESDIRSRAFRWKNGVPNSLLLEPLTGDTESDVYNGIVSPDGSVVVGRSWNFDNPNAKHICRWSISSANVVTNKIKIADLPADSGYNIEYVNTNGTVVTSGDWSRDVVWRWTTPPNTLVTNIGVLPAFPNHTSRSLGGTSSDGSVLVGSARQGWDGPSRAFRWQNNVTTDLGVLPGDTDAEVDGYGGPAVSTDGSVVVGQSWNAAYPNVKHAFRWTSATGMVNIDTSSPSYVSIQGATGDLSVLVGESGIGAPGGNKHPIRWTSAGGLKDIAPSYNDLWNYSEAGGVSEDGSVVVGNSGSFSGWVFDGFHAFRWTSASGAILLGEPPGATGSQASDTSANGSVVVGTWGDSGGDHAFRWTSLGGMVALPPAPGGETPQYAAAVSSDGLTIVGYASGNTAFRWTSQGGTVVLPMLPGAWNAQANDVSANGLVVVGENYGEVMHSGFRWTSSGIVNLSPMESAWSTNSNGVVVVGTAAGIAENSQEAYIWTPAFVEGSKRLKDYLVSIGVNMANWDELRYGIVSSDGTQIAGNGTYLGKRTGYLVKGLNLPTLAPPTNVAATDGTLTTGVTVTWAAVTGATGYKIYRNGAATAIGTVGAVSTYSDTTAVPGTLYTYTVKATKGSEVSFVSSSDTGYRNLTAPLGVAATDGTLTTGVTVTWAASTGATGYQVWRAIGAGVAVQIGTVGAVLTYSDVSAVAGTLYTYTVRAITAAALSAASLGNTGYRNLTAPLSVAATDGTLTTGVTVTWAASIGATGYQVWRAIGAGVAAQLGTVGAVLAYSDTTAIPGTLYTYTVKATGAVGVSLASVSNTGYRQLSAPLTVAATDGTLTTGVTVTWAASTGATGYKIYRDGSESALATVGAVLTYSDVSAIPGISYTYTVKATGAVGISAASLGNTGYRNLTAPLSVAATDGTLTTGVTVTWAASTGATGYQVWRAIGTGVAAQITTVGAVLTYSDTTAIAGTLYTYTVKATSAVGVSAASLGNTGYRSLIVPLSVAATDGSSTANVTVTWAASSGATGYQVWRALGTGVAAQIATVGAVVTYSDTTAVAGTLYTYSVKAVAAAGVSAASIGNTGYRNLPAPLSVAATDGTLTTGVTVTWAASTGATGYKIYRDGSESALATVGAVLTYSDVSTVPGISYTYTVKATGSVGVSAASLGNTGYRNLTAPLSIAATDGSSTANVTVTWAASTGATGYQVWRALGAGVAAQITTVGAVLTYSDTTAIAGTLYTYTVKATGAVGVSAASLGNTGYRSLTAPLSVAATDGSSTANVTVTWAAASGATGYQVWRAIGTGVAAQIATVGAVVTYSDTTAVAGTLYTYSVKAVAAAGASAASIGNTGYRNLTAPLTVAATDGTLTTGVTVTWAASTGATGYQVWRAIGTGVAAQIGTVSAVLTYSDTTAIAGTSYTYTVKATGAVSVSAASLGNTGYRNLTAPLSVAATDGSSTANVTVTWAASTGATGYQVFRSGTAAAIAVNVVSNSFIDSSTSGAPLPGTLYTYTVKATGAVGVSAASLGNTGYRNRVGPATVTATDTDTEKVRVSWTAITGTPAATGYEVWRTIGESAPVPIVTIGNTLFTYDDRDIDPGVTALYSVKAKYVLVGSLPATTVTTLPTSDTGIRPVGATGGDDGGIAGGPESSTTLPSGSGNKGDESENAAGSGDSQNAATDPADDGTENPQGEVKPEVKPEEKPDECIAIALALADQIDALKNQLKQSVKDESATVITQKLLDRMRMLMEPVRDGELAVCAMTRGDVTLDGVIDNDDLGAFLESWSADDLIGADLNRDGRITAADMAIVLSAIDAECAKENSKAK